MTTPTTDVEALRLALNAIADRAASLTTHETANLQARVCAAVDEMKGVGVPPERIVVRVKSLAAETGISAVGHRLVERMASWCIEHYYHPKK